MEDLLIKEMRLAGYARDVAAGRKLLEKGFDVNALEDPDRLLTFAMKYAQYGNDQMLSLLIEAGCDLEAKDGMNWTVAHFAVYHDKPKCLQLLIAAGCDIEAKTKSWISPTGYAIRQGHVNCLALLIAAGARIDESNDEGLVLEMLAVNRKQPECLALLVASKEASELRTSLGRGAMVKKAPSL